MLLAAFDPSILLSLIVGVVIIFLCLLLKKFKQPYVIAYILAGVVLGQHGFAVIEDEDVIRRMGDVGLILLLFFIGMEIDLKDLLKTWKVNTLATVFQVIGSLILTAILGWIFDWALPRIIILGFVISLSSSAVVIKLLQDRGEIRGKVGQSVLGVLLIQDIIIVPMLITAGYLGGNNPSVSELVLQLCGGILLILFLLWLIKKGEIRLPYSDSIKKDHELQVFIAFLMCFGFAGVTAFFGLSAALGAFIGGLFVHSAHSTDWFHNSLHSFRVIFVALFFLSVGMLIDLHFLWENRLMIFLLLLSVYISNHFINALVLRRFLSTWQESLYGGALLAQIGELSFVIAALAFESKIINNFTYQTTVLIIALTLLISPFWISLTRKLTGLDKIQPYRHQG